MVMHPTAGMLPDKEDSR